MYSIIVNLLVKGDAFAGIEAMVVGAYGCYLISTFALRHTMQLGYSPLTYTKENASSREFGLIVGVSFLLLSLVDPFVISYY